MKYLNQILIILFVCFLAEILSEYLPIGIPSSIYGLFLMFLALYLKLVKIDQIKQSVIFLIEIMPVVFVPIAVGLMTSFDKLLVNYLPILAILFSTVFIMIISGLVTQYFYNRSIIKQREKNE